MPKTIQESEKEQATIRKNNFDSYLQQIRKEMKELEKGEKEKTKAIQKAEKDKVREHEKAEKEKERIAAASRRSIAKASSTAMSQARIASSTGIQSGLGQGLTSRADIYMHANAMRTLIGSGRGLLEMYGNLQLAEAGLAAFTTSAKETAYVMAEIKDHAEKTTFTRIGLAQATRNMMAYGLSAKNALEHMKMLGDVAGGSEIRFERLSYAMAQITSTGKLQGQELRQLTEQGFNPLETMSRYTGRSMEELRKMMADGLITSEHVTEALKIETSAGGRFANMQKKMADTFPGVKNQLKELIQNLKMGFLKVIEKDLVRAMKLIIGYLKQFEKYMETAAGQTTVKTYAEIAAKVFAAVLAFHALGFAMASLMWTAGSVYSTFSRIFAVLRVLSLVISGIAAVASSPFLLMVAAGVAAAAVVAHVADQIYGPVSMYSALMYVWQTAQAFFQALYGFLYNFQSNWAIISTWLASNWQSVISDMMEITVRFIGAMGSNFFVGIRTVARLFLVFSTWMFSFYKSLFSGELFNAMVDGFMRVFTWLESKWKKFGEFMSKIWENLFDPVALGQVLWEGMGLDQTTQAMTEDIITTANEGLYAGIANVLESEGQNLSTGMEGFVSQAAPMPQLNYSVPGWPPPAAAPVLPDAGKYSGSGFNFGASKSYKATETMSATGSDYNKLLAEQSMRSPTPKANPQLAAQQQTNNLLSLIYTALRGAPQVNLQPAGVGGQGANP